MGHYCRSRRGLAAVAAGRVRRRRPLAVALLGLAAAPAARGVVITFADQPAGDGPMNPSTYTSQQGLPSGITAAFSGFSRSDLYFDHSGDGQVVYGTNTTPATITFNTPVSVPSLWVSTGDFGSTTATVTGSLGGTVQFTFVNSGSSGAFHQVTGGAGKSVDLITFSKFSQSLLDDVTVNAVPEPVAEALLGVAALGLLRRRRGTRAWGVA